MGAEVVLHPLSGRDQALVIGLAVEIAGEEEVGGYLCSFKTR